MFTSKLSRYRDTGVRQSEGSDTKKFLTRLEVLKRSTGSYRILLSRDLSDGFLDPVSRMRQYLLLVPWQVHIPVVDGGCPVHV